MLKGSKLYSILFEKCPRCHEGDLYEANFWQSAKDLLKGNYRMYKDCNHCDLHYEMEPGFWWGAMYIAYSLSSGALLITAGICKLGFGLTVNETMVVVLIVAAIGFLYNARVSRNIWINIYVHFDKKYAAKQLSNNEE